MRAPFLKHAMFPVNEKNGSKSVYHFICWGRNAT